MYDMNNYKIFFHVGYPKAASTSLQINLFANHPEINNLSKESDKSAFLNQFYYNLKHLKPSEYQQIDHSYISNNYLTPILDLKKNKSF